jgi:hypothetical protein
MDDDDLINQLESRREQLELAPQPIRVAPVLADSGVPDIRPASARHRSRYHPKAYLRVKATQRRIKISRRERVEQIPD